MNQGGYPMSKTKLLGGLAASMLMAGVVSACTASATVQPVPTPSDGTMTVDFTIENQKDPGLCADFAIDRLDLLIMDASGAAFTSVSAICEDFAITVQLPEGTYSADATLVDVNGNAVSDTLPLDNID